MTIDRRQALQWIAAVALSACGGRWGRQARFTPMSCVAFSLREAQRRLERSGEADREVMRLGGLTSILGVVEDGSGDCVLAGELAPGRPELSLDLLVDALRAVTLKGAYPLLSIDRTPSTPVTGLMDVRVEGMARDCTLSAQLLRVDLYLKRAALGREAMPFPSYFDLSRKALLEGTASAGRSRLWFHPRAASVLVREQALVVRALSVGVRTEKTSGEAPSDAAAEDFAENMGRYARRPRSSPEIEPLVGLFQMVAAAKGLASFPGADVDYYLHRYRTQEISVPAHVAVLERREDVSIGGEPRTLQVSGGIDTGLLASRLADGEWSAFRDTILASRPAGALSWPISLGPWPYLSHPEVGGQPSPANLGTTLETEIGPVDTAPRSDERGGVEFDLDPKRSGAPSEDIAGQVLNGRPGANSGVWHLRKER